MDVRIKTNGIEMTPELSAYVNERIAALEKLVQGDESVRFEVEIGKDAGGQKHGAHIWFAEFHIVRTGAESVTARNNGETLNEAINDAKEEAARQLRKDKTKHTSVVRRQAARFKEWLRFGGGNA